MGEKCAELVFCLLALKHQFMHTDQANKSVFSNDKQYQWHVSLLICVHMLNKGSLAKSFSQNQTDNKSSPDHQEKINKKMNSRKKIMPHCWQL